MAKNQICFVKIFSEGGELVSFNFKTFIVALRDGVFISCHTKKERRNFRISHGPRSHEAVKLATVVLESLEAIRKCALRLRVKDSRSGRTQLRQLLRESFPHY